MAAKLHIILDESKDNQECSSDSLEIKFPLPEHVDPSQCRDEFLKTLIEEHEIRISKIHRSTIRKSSLLVRPVEIEYQIDKGAEAMVVHQLAKQRQRGTLRKTLEEVMESIRLRSYMFTELNLECQKAAIEFLSVRLLKQLRLFSGPWPGDLHDIPYHLFSWSLDDFLMRLDVKQLYLDVLNRERNVEDLDCVKFCKDLHEIELLIHEIRNDFRNNKDICQSSMQMLRNAQYITNAPWVKTLEKNMQDIKHQTAQALSFNRSSIFMMEVRHTSVMCDFDHDSFLDPIEMRYQINWLRSCTDQCLMRINERENSMMNELNDMEEEAWQDESVQHSSELMYSLQLGDLRERIKVWQERQEVDLENVEVMCTVSRFAVQKLKDDLKFYTEQKEMYLRRIDEVEAIINQERMIREQREAALNEKRMSNILERGSGVKSGKKTKNMSDKNSNKKSGKKPAKKSARKSERKSERKSTRKSEILKF
ncbi:uncharacterized protein LOC108105673 [Drosophila eugracilis]|uniref:uncharacterized protein LOC108105673 n=1 Tax=Drosophila eugracilis TaxID=29029 RepID=UPI0007E875DE|nr:uncharacterized protein LOC108105673 [Drosophila eugracilis]